MKSYKYFFMLTLVFFVTGVQAQVGLIIPLATVHNNSSGNNVDYNNTNRGVGIQYQQSSYLHSVVYIDKNSFNKSSTYVSSAYIFVLGKGVEAGAGVTLATGYKSKHNNTIVVRPALSIQYKHLRLVTTHPLGTLHGSDDYFNLQWVHNF